ncbi:MFS transporter [Granulicella cerasi]|uniref:MFS transporter n=1 Tax=Granulicella cerasi TaxID=741063 RepID=A0ABW1ZAE0_9BACT|nr:MFS transporter [Granulicella cerasi]
MPPHHEPPLENPKKFPVWAMGLANAPTGFVYGFISTAMGIMLASRGVSVAKIGAISALAFSPTFWAWLFAPILDVRFTKRFYALILAVLAAVLLAGAVVSMGDLSRFAILLTASSVAATLYSNAVAGWAPDVLADEEFDTMSGWFNVANLGAAGVFSIIAVTLMHRLPATTAAAFLALLVLAPALLLLWFPAPRQPEGTLAANFSAMRRDLFRVLRGSRIWLGLAIFLSPIAFALTNIFSSLGDEFHVPERWVTNLNGLGVAGVCSIGCLLAIPACRRWPRRNVFVLAAVGAAIFAAFLALTPHTLGCYAVGVLGYNFFQGFNYTAFVALALEITGPGNALSGTMMAMLTASMNVPIAALIWLDSRVHDRWGLQSMLWFDCLSAVVTAVVLLGFVIPRMERWVARREGHTA